MIQTSRFLIVSRQIFNHRLNKFASLINISSKAFASKNKDGAGQSDKEVDKSKKTVKSAAAPEAEKKTDAAHKKETAAEAPKQAQTPSVRVIESIPGDRVSIQIFLSLKLKNKIIFNIYF